MTNFDEISKELHETAKSKGFYDDLKMDEFVSQAKQLMMLASEVTEVMEALRKDKGEEAVVEEIADILIRSFDLFAALKESGVVTSSLDDVFLSKTETNKGRPVMHGVLG